jgi:hypothetical protein
LDSHIKIGKRMLENRILRRIFGPGKDEATGSIDGRITLTCMWRMWTGFIWLRIGTGGVLLCTQ